MSEDTIVVWIQYTSSASSCYIVGSSVVSVGVSDQINTRDKEPSMCRSIMEIAVNIT